MNGADDPFDLKRFLTAQAGNFDAVRRELASCQKKTHWIWYVFPQYAGLGHSWRSHKYAIGSAAEAVAYLGHPVLGSRLLECTRLVCRCSGRAVGSIFPSPDDMKFHSCMTLFKCVSAQPEFKEALDTFFDGREDDVTVALLAAADATG